MTIPGVGLVIAVGLIAAIGPVTRIAGPDRLVAHLGLNPGVYQSGSGKPRHARITIQERGVQLGMLFLDGTSVRALQKTAGAARRGDLKLSETIVRRLAALVADMGPRLA